MNVAVYFCEFKTKPFSTQFNEQRDKNNRMNVR